MAGGGAGGAGGGGVRWGELVLLLMLYLVQGLPFGMQVKTLPILLRQEGVSLSAISSLGILSLPWLVKLAWAPLVDSYYWPRFGRRKSWIVPCLIIIGGAALTVLPSRSIPHMLVVIFVMNLAASVQDIATDGLAIDVLTDEKSLAFGNAAQVVGFKAGMMLAGGLVPWYFADNPWLGCFGVIAVVTMGLAALLLMHKGPITESAPATSADKGDTASATSAAARPAVAHDVEDIVHKMKEVFGMILRQFKQPAVRPLLLLLLTYKSGEVMADVMFKPFLLDEGVEADLVSLWTGVIGSAFSIVGSLAGGYCSGRFSARTTLLVSGVLRVAAQLGRALAAVLTVSADSPLPILTLIATEAITGGVVTTAVFTLMMAQSQPGVAGTPNTATFYTTLTTVELVGKSAASILSGVFAEHMGYEAFFFFTAILSAIPLWFARNIKSHAQ
ncbi:major facilitator superfamily transporter permease [Salpingoeca rosetta]|uniref:Major facilitator superfamily transporter permease n=1 Tax=Salpingoeca rosetta (strain ATCC 50818 / BSB-021) TaxID=946362 RepID=F2U0E8_SALR5|nr:major facilitator superfamily transporter permease [Salpingoeca rosetta]EGD80876.1 major facilitator superfamily transporter permease [Salpingoeca rosetta]|eukprot:XP_004997437.1 major facilitator superfamily transporter permease [Salpingoeca rosetta]